MATSCNVHGIIGICGGRAFAYSHGKNFWKHDGFLPLPTGDLAIEFFTFGGDAAPLEDGPYSGIACVITQQTAGSNGGRTPIYHHEQDFAPMPAVASDNDSPMPSPVFMVIGRVSVMDIVSFALETLLSGLFYLVFGRFLAYASKPPWVKLTHPSHQGDLRYNPQASHLPTLHCFNWKGKGVKRAKYEDDSNEVCLCLLKQIDNANAIIDNSSATRSIVVHVNTNTNHGIGVTGAFSNFPQGEAVGLHLLP
ncbi:hypothetical protein EDD15DRAFT_2198542 [Pisolithus albus]|nr:hypothetical protein EDD15DRAFT_2198542 [Pisolithus albus]